MAGSNLPELPLMLILILMGVALFLLLRLLQRMLDRERRSHDTIDPAWVERVKQEVAADLAAQRRAMASGGSHLPASQPSSRGPDQGNA
jgi:hypothetical protein